MNRLTNEQAAVLSAFTGTLCGPVSDFHQYVNKIMGRPVWTHELASEKMEADIREAARADFMALCATAGEIDAHG